MKAAPLPLPSMFLLRSSAPARTTVADTTFILPLTLIEIMASYDKTV